MSQIPGQNPAFSIRRMLPFNLIKIFVFGGGTIFSSLKDPVKGGKAVKAGTHGNLCYGNVGVNQKTLCV